MSNDRWNWSDSGTQSSSTGYRQSSSSAVDDYKPDRGGCLTTWLVVAGIVNVLLLILTFIGLGVVKTISALDIVGIIFNVLVIVAIVGMWRWKKWGYYLLLGMFIGSIVLRIFTLLGSSGSFGYLLGTIVGGGIVLLIMYLLVRDKLEYFD
ncbi:MAG TPA: hypothetical protein VHZ51_02380 [Ktedonobacteraceae bacterium]|nr:hypothetical protein [Ktedonobacteraceae bacterium]